MEPHDLGRTFEGAEHEDDASIGSKVGDGLDAAAEIIEIRYPLRTENAERIQALGRNVDVTTGSRRRGSDEEDPLCEDELADGIVQFLVQLAHAENASTIAAAVDLWGDVWLGCRMDVLERQALDLYLLPQVEVGVLWLGLADCEGATGRIVCVACARGAW